MAIPADLVVRYPRLFHMAEYGSWPSIQQHGLLSTTALLDLFGYHGVERAKLESQWRQTSVTIQHANYGVAVIRDQRPMPPVSLERVLDDMTIREWYEFLNRKTFFWPTLDRLKKMLTARLYRGRTHDVLTVDTSDLISRYADLITLSPINSGFTLFGRPKRGRNTFRRIEDYSLGSTASGVAELAVDMRVPEVAEITLSVERWRGDKLVETIWKR